MSGAGIRPRPVDLLLDGGASVLAASARLGEDPVAHRVIQRCADRGDQQRPGVGVTEPVQTQLGQPGERATVTVVGLAQREHQHHPFGRHPSRHERQDLRGHAVQPLRIVHEAQQRPLLGDLGEQVEGGQTDQEPVRRSAAAQPERHVQGGLLRVWQRAGPVQQRRAQLVQACERELRLGLRPDRARHPESRWGRVLAGVIQQRGLADARFAA